MKKNLPAFKIFFAVFIFACFTLIIGGVYLASLFGPVSADAGDVQFVVPRGQSIDAIGKRLEQDKIIKSHFAFKIMVRKEGLDNEIQAGSFTLNPSMSLREVAYELTTGTQDMWVTIQEGWRAEEIAQSMVRQGFSQFDEADFLALATSSEGMLFPDTYLLPKEISAEQFYNLLINTYERKIATLQSEIDNSSRTAEEILIMASIVEREGRGYEDLRNIAGILWNRIDLPMALQVDATLQYVKGYNKVEDSWWSEPSAADKTLKSPFNTYLNPGLPPSPISNPSLDAIRATLNPISSNNLYYLHDNNGIGRYSATYEDHLDNINRYLR